MPRDNETGAMIFSALVILGAIIYFAQQWLPVVSGWGAGLLILSIIIFIIESLLSAEHSLSPWVFGGSALCFVCAAVLWVFAVPVAQSPVGVVATAAKNVSDTLNSATDTVKESVKVQAIETNRMMNGNKSTGTEQLINGTFAAYDIANTANDMVDNAATAGKIAKRANDAVNGK